MNSDRSNVSPQYERTTLINLKCTIKHVSRWEKNRNISISVNENIYHLSNIIAGIIIPMSGLAASFKKIKASFSLYKISFNCVDVTFASIIAKFTFTNNFRTFIFTHWLTISLFPRSFISSTWQLNLFSAPLNWVLICLLIETGGMIATKSIWSGWQSYIIII